MKILNMPIMIRFTTKVLELNNLRELSVDGYILQLTSKCGDDVRCVRLLETGAHSREEIGGCSSAPPPRELKFKEHKYFTHDTKYFK